MWLSLPHVVTKGRPGASYTLDGYAASGPADVGLRTHGNVGAVDLTPRSSPAVGTPTICRSYGGGPFTDRILRLEAQCLVAARRVDLRRRVRERLSPGAGGGLPPLRRGTSNRSEPEP